MYLFVDVWNIEEQNSGKVTWNGSDGGVEGDYVLRPMTKGDTLTLEIW